MCSRYLVCIHASPNESSNCGLLALILSTDLSVSKAKKLQSFFRGFNRFKNELQEHYTKWCICESIIIDNS